MILPVAPLPVDGPAAGLDADIVGGGPGHEDHRGSGVDGQSLVVVLEQDQGLGYGFLRQGSMFVRADDGRLFHTAIGLVKEAQLGLDREDAGHGVIDAFLGDIPGLDGLGQGADELFVVVGDHDHVQPGIDAGDHVGIVVAGDLVDGLPIGDDKAVEIQLALQHIVDQIALAVEFLAVPTAVGDHDALGTGVDRGHIGGQVKRRRRVSSSMTVSPWSMG